MSKKILFFLLGIFTFSFCLYGSRTKTLHDLSPEEIASTREEVVNFIRRELENKRQIGDSDPSDYLDNELLRATQQRPQARVRNQRKSKEYKEALRRLVRPLAPKGENRGSKVK